MKRVVAIFRAVPAATGCVLVVVFFAIGAATIDGFASWYSISAILTLAAFVGLAAAGQTVVMLLGGLDLSIPFIIGMGNVVFAGLLHRGWSTIGAAGFVLVGATIVGAINGALSVWLEVPSVIVTLGTGVFVQGLYLYWTAAQPVGSAPTWLTRAVAPGSTTGPIPVSPVVLFWAGFSVALVAFLRWSIAGRKLYATGANPVAAKLSLIRTKTVWVVAFAGSAACAGLTGMLLLGFTGSASATVGAPYLFSSIGAVVLGGTSILGGQGGYGATVIGAVLLTELTLLLVAVGASLPGVGSSQALGQTVLGAAIIVMVAGYGREPHVRDRI